MPIKLFFSNRLEALADKLLEMLGHQGYFRDDLLRAPKVVVPNTNLARWLQLTIACRQSICMNIDFDFLDRGLWQLLGELHDGHTANTLLEQDDLKILLLYALQQLPADEQLLPLQRYLRGASGQSKAGQAARLWQLAEILAHLFSEYELHRGDMIARWQKQAPAPDPMEACQQRLYLYLQELSGAGVYPGPGRQLSLSQYAAQVFSSGRQPASGRPLSTVHFFALSQISALHLDLFHRLRPYFEMIIYVMNPCREFWEDLRTPAEQRWLHRKNVRRLRILPQEEARGELQTPAAHDLLTLWGKPGRESIRRFCALTDYDFAECFVSAGPGDSVLKALQHDILTLGGGKTQPAGHPQDHSLQIGACPGLYREVEAVYNSIVFNLEHDDSLRLTDIAVMVPDMALYKPALEAVFNRYPAALSFNLVDSRAERESLYGQAVLKLLELARGKFSRREVFDLLLNPCVMQKWDVTAEDVRTWAVWARRLNIFHSFDELDKQARGYPDGIAYTWKQGLLRLRLGRVLCDPDEMPGAPSGRFHHFHRIVPSGEAAGSDQGLLETFCLLMETLHRGVQRLKDLRAGGLRWKETLSAVCDELMQVPGGAHGEESVRRALAQAFDRFGCYDRLSDGARRVLLDVELILEFVKSSLGAIAGGRGEYLTGGVTISALQPMRPIPFRIIYVLGLQEGSFPGKSPHSSLDLRQARRRIGDVSLTERNRYLFLETLLSARERLYLTYVARDLQKDRQLMPGSVLSQLRRYLEDRILPEAQSFQITEVPLKGSDAAYAQRNGDPQAGDLCVNFSWADRLAFYRSQGLWPQALAACSAAMRQELTRFCPDLAAAAVWSPDRGGTARLTIGELKAFLVDPAAAGMRRHLGFYGEDPDVEEMTAEEDEPFFTGFPANYRLITEPLIWWLENAQDPEIVRSLSAEEIYENYYDHLARQGMTPEAVYADLDRRALKALVSRRAGLLEDILTAMRTASRLYRAVLIGDPDSQRPSGRRPFRIRQFEALELAPAKSDRSTSQDWRPVRLHGELPWLWRSARNRWHTLVLTGANSTRKTPTRYVIAPVLFYLSCLAADQTRAWLGNGAFHVHVAYNTCIRTFIYAYSRPAARNYLAALAAEILNPQTMDWMPFDVVARREKMMTAPEAEVRPADRDAFRAFLMEAFEKSDPDYLTRLADPVIGSSALDRARARFSVFFNTVDRN